MEGQQRQPQRPGEKPCRWGFWTAFTLLVLTFVIGGYFVIWAEIDRIRDLIPVENRDGSDSCYTDPLLNFQIWTKEGNFQAIYTMQEVVEYAICLETTEAIDRAQIFYVSYYIIGLAILMIIIVFLYEMAGMQYKSGLQLVLFPFLFGIGEGVTIFYLLGCYKNDGIGGLDETLCQLCGCMGLIFWVLFAFIILFLIFLCLKNCRKLCSNDRQKGMHMATVRDLDGCHTLYARGTYEMMGTPRNKVNSDLAKTGLF